MVPNHMKFTFKEIATIAGIVVVTIAVVRLVKGFLPIPASLATYLP